MRQKTIVGLIMAAGAALMIAVGGWVMALIVLVLICFGVQEEFHALAQAGHRPVAWPTWVGMIVSIPLTLLIGTKMILPVIMAICLMTMICVIFRSEPKLDDAVLSMLPMLTVALPGMSAISFTHIEPKALQVTLITLMIGIPCMADAFAMWVGKAVKGPKLCPTVSPNKTISGAIGGVVGALLHPGALGADGRHVQLHDPEQVFAHGPDFGFGDRVAQRSDVAFERRGGLLLADLGDVLLLQGEVFAQSVPRYGILPDVVERPQHLPGVLQRVVVVGEDGSRRPRQLADVADRLDAQQQDHGEKNADAQGDSPLYSHGL